MDVEEVATPSLSQQAGAGMTCMDAKPILDDSTWRANAGSHNGTESSANRWCKKPQANREGKERQKHYKRIMRAKQQLDAALQRVRQQEVALAALGHGSSGNAAIDTEVAKRLILLAPCLAEQLPATEKEGCNARSSRGRVEDDCHELAVAAKHIFDRPITTITPQMARNLNRGHRKQRARGRRDDGIFPVKADEENVSTSVETIEDKSTSRDDMLDKAEALGRLEVHVAPDAMHVYRRASTSNQASDEDINGKSEHDKTVALDENESKPHGVGSFSGSDTTSSGYRCKVGHALAMQTGHDASASRLAIADASKAGNGMSTVLDENEAEKYVLGNRSESGTATSEHHCNAGHTPAMQASHDASTSGQAIADKSKAGQCMFSALDEDEAKKYVLGNCSESGTATSENHCNAGHTPALQTGHDASTSGQAHEEYLIWDSEHERDSQASGDDRWWYEVETSVLDPKAAIFVCGRAWHHSRKSYELNLWSGWWQIHRVYAHCRVNPGPQAATNSNETNMKDLGISLHPVDEGDDVVPVANQFERLSFAASRQAIADTSKAGHGMSTALNCSESGIATSEHHCDAGHTPAMHIGRAASTSGQAIAGKSKAGHGMSSASDENEAEVFAEQKATHIDKEKVAAPKADGEDLGTLCAGKRGGSVEKLDKVLSSSQRLRLAQKQKERRQKKKAMKAGNGDFHWDYQTKAATADDMSDCGATCGVVKQRHTKFEPAWKERAIVSHDGGYVLLPARREEEHEAREIEFEKPVADVCNQRRSSPPKVINPNGIIAGGTSFLGG